MNEEEKGLTEFLVTMAAFNSAKKPNGFKYKNMYEFILKNGNLHKIIEAEYTPIYKMGKKKECFTNAYNLVDNFPDKLTYVEGYACSVSIPIYHAWAVSKTGHVFDPTWNGGKAYYGVEFPLDYVRKTILKRKCWGVIDAWEIGWPLLTGEDPYPTEGGDRTCIQK